MDVWVSSEAEELVSLGKGADGLCFRFVSLMVELWRMKGEKGRDSRRVGRPRESREAEPLRWLFCFFVFLFLWRNRERKRESPREGMAIGGFM